MSVFHSYSKVERLEKEECDGILNGGCYIFEKIDGCLHEDTLIDTSLGLFKIREMYERKKDFLNQKIKSFDSLKCKETDDIILNVLSKKSKNIQWYEIKLDSGESLLITENHRVWLPELNCWREVKYLNENDKILLKR